MSIIHKCSWTKQDVYSEDNDGLSAAMHAARGGHLTCLQLILEKGFNINARSRNGGVNYVYM